MCLALTSLAAAAPVAAESVFEKLYPAKGDAIELPYPFAELLADLARKVGGAEIRTAFIPLGRSLQRYAADPDFFKHPRILAGVTGAGPGALKDRLYFGYQPVSKTIEIIAFDETGGRFVFHQVTDYGDGKAAQFSRLDDAVCAGCHQAKGPIFAAAPWSESNANPAVVARLPKSIEGLEVKQDFDGVDFLDRSTRRANRLTAAAMLWREGCATRTCRAALLGAALRLRLGEHEEAAGYFESLATRWPQGLALPGSKIADRDPVAMLAEGKAPADVIEALGAFDPEQPRAPQVHWSPREDGAAGAARLLGELIDQGQVKALKEELGRRGHNGAWLAGRLDGIAAGAFVSAALDGTPPSAATLAPLLAHALADAADEKGGSQ
jgi:hypothetical protein